MTRRSNRRRRVGKAGLCDEQARSEGNAIRVLGNLCPQRAGSHVTSSIPWAPSKPSGLKGWLRLSKTRKMRAPMVRGRSNHTPKLQASYVRAFGTPDDVQ